MKNARPPKGKSNMIGENKIEKIPSITKNIFSGNFIFSTPLISHTMAKRR